MMVLRRDQRNGHLDNRLGQVVAPPTRGTPRRSLGLGFRAVGLSDQHRLQRKHEPYGSATRRSANRRLYGPVAATGATDAARNYFCALKEGHTTHTVSASIYAPLFADAQRAALGILG